MAFGLWLVKPRQSAWGSRDRRVAWQPGSWGVDVAARKRHVPQRTCVACRQVQPKRDLVRIVRGLDGRVHVDASGRVAGRGAYLCRSRACWELALKRKHLEHALMTSLTSEDRTALAAYALVLTETDRAVD